MGEHDDREIKRAITAGFKDVSKWLALQNETLRDGLAAIALAASTPEDNSAEVQAKIDALTGRVKASTDALQNSSGTTSDS